MNAGAITVGGLVVYGVPGRSSAGFVASSLIDIVCKSKSTAWVPVQGIAGKYGDVVFTKYVPIYFGKFPSAENIKTRIMFEVLLHSGSLPTTHPLPGKFSIAVVVVAR